MAVRLGDPVGGREGARGGVRGWLGVGAGVSGVMLGAVVVFGGNIWMWHDAPVWRQYTWGDWVIPVWVHPVIRWLPVMALVFAVMPVLWVARRVWGWWRRGRKSICPGCSCVVGNEEIICPGCGTEVAWLERWMPRVFYGVAAAFVGLTAFGIVARDWYRMVIGPSLAVVFVVMARTAARDYWRKVWRGRGACGACGYDLTGNASGVCPECGGVVDATAVRRGSVGG